MTSAPLPNPLYDAIERLDPVAAKAALRDGAQVTERCLPGLRSQHKLPFEALFGVPCEDPHQYRMFLAVEDLLHRYRAPVSEDTFEGQHLLAGVVFSTFQQTRQGLLTRSQSLARMKQWLAHPEMIRRGEAWGPSCFHEWKRGITLGEPGQAPVIDPDLDHLAHALPTLLLAHGMPLALFDQLATDDPRRQWVPALVALDRSRAAHSEAPARNRRRFTT
jgi:hypothetical protein